MPTAERTFDVQAPADEVWQFLSDFTQLGACLPGCERVEIVSAHEADWHMERKVGFLRKRFVVRTHTTDFVEPQYASWTGESKELSLSGRVDVRPLASRRTSVTYQGAVRAKGPAKQILNRYFRSRLDRDIDEFVRNVRAQLESGPAKPNAQSTDR